MLGLRLILHVVNLSNITLLFLIAFETVVDAGRRTRRLVEESLQSLTMIVYCILVRIVAWKD